MSCKINEEFDAEVRAFKLISDIFGSIFNYGAFIKFSQMRIDLLGNWDIGIAHICTGLNVFSFTRRGNDEGH